MTFDVAYVFLSLIASLSIIVFAIKSQKSSLISPPENKESKLYFFRLIMSNLLNISGDEKASKVYLHFDHLCNSLDLLIEKNKLDNKELAQLLEEFLRPLVGHLSNICLKLNRAHLLRDQSRNKLKNLRTKKSREFRDYKKGRASAKIRIRERFVKTERDWLEDEILAEEKNLHLLKAEYDRLLHALDECICLIHHDCITSSQIQDIFILGRKFGTAEDTRSRIMEELDQLLNTSAEHEYYLAHHYESLNENAKKN